MNAATPPAIGFHPDEIDLSTPTRAARLKWVIVVNDSMDPKRDAMAAVARTRRGAVELLEDDGDRVAGPYVLAERVRQR